MGGFAPVPRQDPTLVSGYRDPSSTVSQRIIADVQDEIAMYMPSANPLLVISSKVRGSREVTQYQFDWLEKDEYPRDVVVSIGYTAADTSVVLQAGMGDRVAANYVMMNKRTREHMLVTAVVTDTLTVVRAIGGIGEAILANDTLEFQRAVFEDGAGIGTLKSIKEDRQFNYTEIIRTPYGFTGRQQNTSMYGGKDPMTERKWQGIEHSKSIEAMMMFGRRHSRTGTGGKIQSFAGGIEFFLKSNIWNLNGVAPTHRAFVEWLEYAMLYGDAGNIQGEGTKYFFCSARWLSVIESWGLEKIQYTNDDTTLGLRLGKFQTAHGTVILVHSPLLVKEHGGHGFLLDLNHVKKVHHQGRNTKLLDKRQGNDIDGEQEEWFSDVSCQVELEAAHGIAMGLPL